jgi:phosphoenolpyruvate synthase/pyruvate phosphate dikinase
VRLTAVSGRDMPMAVGVLDLIHAQASGVAFSASPVTGKTDRVVIETNWGWG